MKFPTGQVVATPAALDFMNEYHIYALDLIGRHTNGDWGDVDSEDAQANEAALIHGDRLMSVYKFPPGAVWIITEWDRSVTTILLPEDY